MANKLIVIFSLIFLFHTAYSTKIEGFEPDYAGRIISFNTYVDPITKLEQPFFEFKIDAKGYFSKEIKIENVTFCYSSIDVYQGMLAIEPGKDLMIKLPPLRVKTFTEKKNPYFKPLTTWIKVESGTERDLNTLISKFESRYNQLTDQYFNQLYFRQSKPILDTVTSILIKEFSDLDNQYFQDQLKYKLLILRSEVLRNNQDELLKKAKLTDFTLPAFIDLTDRIYSNKLVFETNSINGRDLQMAVQKGDLPFILDYFKKKYNLSPLLSDYLVLKILHDAFYSNKFSTSAILTMVKSSHYSNNPIPEIRMYASSVNKKLIHLMKGTKAPVICLKDKNKEQKCSNESSKYKYVVFADLEIQVNREQLKYLTAIEEKYKNQLQIFILLNNEFSERVTNFLQENKIPGTIVSDTEEEYAKKYRVKSYPTNFVLNQNHEIVETSAKSPLDGFEHQFGAILKQEYLKQKRLNNKVE